jgi:hypothetical protein
MPLRFNRKQELYLIDLGLAALLDKALQNGHAPAPEKKQKQKWSEAQRRKFKATMKKVWKAKREAANG